MAYIGHFIVGMSIVVLAFYKTVRSVKKNDKPATIDEMNLANERYEYLDNEAFLNNQDRYRI